MEPTDTIPDPDDELVEVYRVGPMEAELMRSVLEGNNIPCLISGSGIGGAYPVGVGSLGESPLMVRRRDAATARELIDEARRGDFELDEEFEQ